MVKLSSSALFEQAFDAIFLSNINYELLEVNQSMEQLSGFSRDELLSMNLKELVADQEQFEHVSSCISSARKIKDYSFKLATKDHSVKSCVINMSLFSGMEDTDDDNIYVGFIHDVTALEKMNREMLLKEKLSISGKLARNIAHEIRNPLTNINLAADYLLEDDSAVEDYLKMIKRNAGKISELVNELLNNTGLNDLKLEKYDLSVIIEDALDSISDRANFARLTIEKNFQEPLPALMLDRKKMHVAIKNILLNAVEAMDEKGNLLRIRATLPHNEQVKIYIQDNGKGIQSNDLDFLFDPFFTRKEDGIGLGLMNARQIISAHGGKIYVESKEGEGSCFIILLPLNNPTQ